MSRRAPDDGPVTGEDLYEGPVSIWSLLAWHLCAICRTEFRREWGWWMVVGPYHGGIGRRVYCCGVCAPTRNDARRTILMANSVPMRPPQGPSGVARPAGAPR